MIKNLKRGEYFGDLQQEKTSPEVHLSETHYSGGLQIPQHSHERPYFLLLLSGGFEESFTRTSFRCKPYSAVFHPQGASHHGTIESDSQCFNIQVRQPMLDRLHDYVAKPDMLADLRGGELNWLALRVYREYRRADACSTLAIEGLVLEMLASVARGRKPCEKRPPRWMGEVMDLLNDEFQESLRVGEVASRIGVHPVHLSRVFRQFEGQSIADYVRQLRVRFACQQITSSKLELAEVAHDAGFADQSQFSRAFKQLTGVTPGSFRKTMKAA